MFDQFEKATVYRVFAVVKRYEYDNSDFLGHYPTEDLARAKVAERENKAEALFQTYLDKYDKPDSETLHQFYKELCEAEDWDKADAVYKAFENSGVSYNITMQYVETPVVVE